jgi:hypothetical protein
MSQFRQKQYLLEITKKKLDTANQTKQQKYHQLLKSLQIEI